MTDAEALWKATQEKKTIEAELKSLRLKADQYAESFSRLGQILNGHPAGAVFDDQSARVGETGFHFNSKDFDIAEVKEIAGKIRKREYRLTDLTSKLA
jgi:hypothetical protein